MPKHCGTTNKGHSKYRTPLLFLSLKEDELSIMNCPNVSFLEIPLYKPHQLYNGLMVTTSYYSLAHLHIQVENGCIYATALCRAIVYYGSSPVRYSGVLAKEERTKVFNYTHRFLPSLKHANQSMTISGIPKPYVIFSFGQPWGGERSLSKNLVTVVVTYCRALNDVRVRNSVIHDELLFEAQESRDIRIISPTQTDIEAEAFLNPPRPANSCDNV